MENNPYKLWYTCLQYVPLKYWNKRVRNDLGEAQALPFEDCWEGVAELLEEAEPFLCRVIDDKEEAEKWDLWETEGLEAVLLVDLEQPIQTLMPAIEKELRALKKAKKGRPARTERSEYPMARKPDIRQINRLLDVFYLRKVEEMKLWEVGVKLKLAPQADAATKDGKNILNATTSRYMKQADALIWNASQGNFPVY